jgi:hypothetical protein
MDPLYPYVCRTFFLGLLETEEMIVLFGDESLFFAGDSIIEERSDFLGDPTIEDRSDFVVDERVENLSRKSTCGLRLLTAISIER